MNHVYKELGNNRVSLGFIFISSVFVLSTLCMRSIVLSSLNKCHDQMADDPEPTADPEPRPESISDPSRTQSGAE